MRNFVHLHCHSQYSLQDSVMKIEDYVKRVKELGQTSCGLSDHGNLYGLVDFYSAAKKEGIKPIFGLEAYICDDMNQKGKKHKGKKLKGEAETGEDENKTYHVSLFAKNNTGYKNLLKLVSEANTQGFYYKPRIDKKLLAKYSEGLFALSGCLSGEVSKLLLKDDFESAERVIREYLDIFGKSYRLEIMKHGMADQNKVSEILKKFGKKYEIPLIATNDVHYLNRSDSIVAEAIIAIRDNTTLSDPKLKKFDTDEFYLKSTDSMYDLFPENPEYCEETVKIADQCSVDIELGKTIFPTFELSAGEKKEDKLYELCKEGWKSELKDEIEKDKHKEYGERVKYELSVINQNKFTDYFLIVQDIVKFAKSKGIRVGPGRGSAAGSLVSRLLGITDIDPIKYGLYFERFLNPERVSPPDIDLDFADDRRQEVLDYMKQKYGEKKFVSTITFGTYAPRKVIRDSFRVHGFDLATQDTYAKMVPKVIQGIPQPELKDVYKASKEIADLKEQYPDVFALAEKLEGLPTNVGTHASAYILCDQDITEYAPLRYDASQGTISVGLDMYSAEKLGLLKIDFLGIETLAIIDNAIKLIKERHGVLLDTRKFPEEDQKTWDLIDKGDTVGIFQFESDGIRGLLKNAQPKSLNELADCNALYRPGAMKFMGEYCDVKHGRKQPEIFHTLMEPILKETQFQLVYQEQVMKMCQVLGKFSLGEADLIRRAIGKKKKEEVEKGQIMFAEKCSANGISKELIDKIVSWMTDMSRYSFNKSHALAYSINAFHSAYIKSHYPFEFQIALLNKKVKELSDYLTRFYDGKKRGIVINGPDINRSNYECSAVDESIYFGLSQIKGVGEMSVQGILKERIENGEFKDYKDLFLRCYNSLEKKTIEGLVYAGATDRLAPFNRKWKIEKATEHLKYFSKIKKQSIGQIDMFNGDLYINESIFEEGESANFSPAEKLEKEKEVLGFYVSGSPLEEFFEQVKGDDFSNSTKLTDENNDEEIKLAAIITSVRTQKDKKGNTMAFIEAEDEYSNFRGLIFSSNYEKNKRFLKISLPVVLKGRISRGSLMIDKMEKLSNDNG